MEIGKDLDSGLKYEHVNTVSQGNYKVKIRSVLPNKIQINEELIPSAYLGVSMNNPTFWHHSFEYVLRWMEQHVSKPYLLLGDYLNRWNERIFTPAPEKECAERSLEQGRQLLDNYKKINGLNRIEVFHWEDLIKLPDFDKSHAEVQKAFHENKLFSDLLLHSAQKFLQRQMESGSQPVLGFEHAQQLSISYLMEELAVFLVLIRKGIPVQIYPGLQLPVLAQLEKPDKLMLPDEFRNGIFIGLRIKKR